ncbi:MAG: branched-chain amino acid ABC transporter permease [Acidimicrobiales bacterium]
MTSLGARRRLTISTGLIVAAVVISSLLTSSARDGVAVSLVLGVAIAGVSTLTVRGLREAHPVFARATLTVVVLDVTLFATYFFSSITNFNLAIGAAMSITLLGLSFLTGASGQISLGNSAFMGVGALAVAIWANHHSSTPIAVTLSIAVACGTFVGLLLGIPATRLRGPYLAGMTLAFAVAFTAIVNSFTSWTGGDAGLQLPTAVTPPHWLSDFFNAQTSLLKVNTMWLADITIVVTGIAFFFMANLFAGRTGRAMRLVRDNEVAAELVGVSLPRARVIAFMVSSAYAALGGALWTLINNSVQPPSFSLALSITILSLVVIGGIGTISGALIGGVIYAYSNSVISWFTQRAGINPQGNLASQLPGIVFGGLLIVTMLFAPLGIAGAIRRLWARRGVRTPG